VEAGRSSGISKNSGGVGRAWCREAAERRPDGVVAGDGIARL